MSLKRTVARIKVAQRRRREAKEERELRKLALARNKALKDAERAMKLAEAKAGLATAQRKQAKYLPKSAPRVGEKQATKSLKNIVKGAKSVTSFLKKHIK